jgi:hypothetical protein
MSVSRRLWLVLWLALALSGCTEKRPSLDVEEFDASRPDTMVIEAGDAPRPDGAMGDGGLDGEVPDAGDAETPTDSSTLPDAPSDAVPEFDSAVVDVPDRDVCDPSLPDLPRLCANDGECATTHERCLPTGCGDLRRCQPVGRPCLDASDCLAGAQSCVSGVCVPTGSDCGDTRGCPLGFLCEGTPGARHCVDRRRPCGVEDLMCPVNSVCYFMPGINGFCLATTTRCVHHDACLLGTLCRDVDDDGLRECVPDGPCAFGSCPTEGPESTCEVLPLDFVSVCGSHGLCSAHRPCPAGFDCVDGWGTGVTECRPRTEPCQKHSECTTPGTLCHTVLSIYPDPLPAGCR